MASAAAARGQRYAFGHTTAAGWSLRLPADPGARELGAAGLVVAVKYLAWTDQGLLRQVIYQGVREDKPATEIRRPVPSNQSQARQIVERGVERPPKCYLKVTLTLSPLRAEDVETTSVFSTSAAISGH
jgi:hypothetical protein